MSRKFIDDHVRQKGLASELPSSGSRCFDPGHEFQNAVDGTIYRNLGPARDGSIFHASLVNRYELHETFQRTPGVNADLASATEATRVPANRDFEVLGTNAVSGSITFADGGGITLTTAGADEDQTIVTPHLDTAQTAWAATKWNTLDRVVFETNIELAALTAEIVWVGLKLTNDNVVATDDNQVFLRYENGVNSGKFQFIHSAAGTDTTQDTGITVAASTNYYVKILIDGDRRPWCYINGVLAAKGTAVLASDIDLIPYVGVEASAAAAKAINCRGVRMSKDLND